MGTLIAWTLVSGCAARELAETGDSPGGGVPGVNASISFAHEGTLALAPGDIADIVVIGKPAAAYRMTFLLVGESIDASLDKTKVVAGHDGVAMVRLRAPNKATSFVVRAKLDDGPSADLSVAVSDQGFGAVNIQPKYQGSRETREWVAAAVAGKTCQDLSAQFPEDPEGALKAAAEPGEPLVIPVAPVGPNLAVFVRGGHYMWGCVNAPNLVANGTVDVDVPIVNAPIDASDALLDMDMAFSPEPVAWASMLAAQRTLMTEALQPQALAATLLEAMEPLSCDPAAFNQSSAQNLPDVESHLSGYGVDLAQLVEDFAVSGLAAQPPLILGRVSALASEPGYAIFSLGRIGSATPAKLGVPSDYQVRLDVDPDDTARVIGNLFWMPSRYIGNAVTEEALAQYSQHDDMADVLAEAAHCDDLALAYGPSCDSGAVAEMCAQALDSLWQSALDASALAGQSGEIPFSAAGASDYDDYAKLTGFAGSWLGQAKIGQQTAQVSGAVSAEYPQVDPP